MYKLLSSIFILAIIVSGCKSSSKVKDSRKPVGELRILKNPEYFINNKPVTIQNTYAAAAKMKNLTFGDLEGLILKGDQTQTTLAVEELRIRSRANPNKSITILAKAMNDQRTIAGPLAEIVRWYERSNYTEKLEIRMYAIYFIQEIIKTYPHQLKVKQKGDIFYAEKNKAAQHKKEVVATWKKWWENAKNDYISTP